MHHFQPQSNWSELPPDLLIKIVKLLNTTTTINFSCKLQILQFRAVCKSWRCALPIHNKYCDSMLSYDVPLPISASPPHSSQSSSDLCDLGRESSGKFCFVPSTAYIFESLKDPCSVHLLIVDHLSNELGKVHCRNPLLVSHDRSTYWDSKAPRSLNLLDYRVSAVAENYSLRYLSNVGGVFQLPLCSDNYCKKAVLICNPKLKEGMDVVAIVLFDGGVLGQYSFRDQSWEVIYDGKISKCSDVIRSEDGCIAIDHKANAYVVKYDFDSRSLTRVQFAPEITSGRLKRKRLVLNSDNGTLYLVVQSIAAGHRHDKSQLFFTAYGFCENQQIWVKCSGIPEWVLFVGADISFCSKAKIFPGICSGHCIYSCKDSFPPYQGKDDAGLFFTEKMHSLCMFYLGCSRADAISGFRHGLGYDHNPIFSSPSEWRELNEQPPSPCPSQHSIEHDVVQPEGKRHSGDNSMLVEAGNNGTETTSPIAGNDNSDGSKHELEQDPKGKGKRTADDLDHSESNNHSTSKSIKISLSQSSVDHSESESDEEESLGSFQKLAQHLTKLISSSTVPVESDPQGCSIGEAIKDLDSLPNIKGDDDDFYNSAVTLLLNKRNRELFMCFEDAELKYKWLRYLRDRY